eukprot:TRINITY_DN6110_c0_g1_i2.p1 TRINITY_DN6110_c0_g1~~TRINITY_DN6110_c0_g1_i2.p1  ORF type:complete len:859 (-),score=215.94 TRINITY_DN6110_c0_g1_i2:92-2518(-)
MSSLIHFTPLMGASDDGPLCYLLEIDEYKILLDCGWTEPFDVSMLASLAKVAPQIDAVLVSHADIAHLGALPYAVGKLGLRAKIFMTLPVYKMGQMVMYDVYQSLFNESDFSTFDLDDVDLAFEFCTQLKYSQSAKLIDANEQGGVPFKVTPYPSGRTLGGTAWRISLENEEIVYAVNYNHKKEQHLDPFDLNKNPQLMRPMLLVTDAYNTRVTGLLRKKLDNRLLENIVKTLRGSGNVLLPCDAAGRALELLLLLDGQWKKRKLGAYGLVLLHNTSGHTVDFAKSMLEWMSGAVISFFEQHRQNLMAFKYVTVCHSIDEVKRLRKRPMVLVSTSHTLETGFGRTLFAEWAGDPRNLVVFTQRSPPGTLAAHLMSKKTNAPKSETVPRKGACSPLSPDGSTLSLRMSRRVPLEGEELEEYRRKLEDEEKEQAAQAILEAATQGETDAALVGETEEDVQERVMKKMDADFYFKNESDHDLCVFDPFKKPYPMFPLRNTQLTFDEYGEVIDANDYVSETDRLAREAREAELKSGGLPGDVVMAARDAGIEDDDEDDEELPTKCISADVQISLRCGFLYVDIEGRSDGRSVKEILKKIAPRKVVLINGSEVCRQELKDVCEASGRSGGGGGAGEGDRSVFQTVLLPKVDECVDVTSDLKMMRVHLKDSLLKNLRFVDMAGGYEVAFVDGLLKTAREMQGPMAMPVLEEHPTHNAATEMDVDAEVNGIIPHENTRGHDAIFLGDVRLADFKRTVAASNQMDAQLAGGVLMCNQSVKLKKSSTSDHSTVSMEGLLGEDFFAVRDTLYKQYHVL